MKKVKKALVYLFLSILVLGIIPNSSYAAAKPKKPSTGGIELYAEQVSWYYRYVNGRLQKRLWSHTYGYWRTDWIWV